MWGELVRCGVLVFLVLAALAAVYGLIRLILLLLG